MVCGKQRAHDTTSPALLHETKPALTDLISATKIRAMNAQTDSSLPANHQASPQYAGVLRRLTAIVYDSLLLAAVLMLAMALLTLFTGDKTGQSHNPFINSYLVSVIFLFYGWFWTHGGQTLGMRSWKLRLEQENGQPITWWHALLRFLTAIPAWTVFILGLFFCISPTTEHVPPMLKLLEALPCWLLVTIGTGWIMSDNWKNAWRDRFTHTRVIQLSNN